MFQHTHTQRTLFRYAFSHVESMARAQAHHRKRGVRRCKWILSLLSPYSTCHKKTLQKSLGFRSQRSNKFAVNLALTDGHIGARKNPRPSPSQVMHIPSARSANSRGQRLQEAYLLVSVWHNIRVVTMRSQALPVAEKLGSLMTSLQQRLSVRPATQQLQQCSCPSLEPTSLRLRPTLRMNHRATIGTSPHTRIYQNKKTMRRSRRLGVGTGSGERCSRGCAQLDGELGAVCPSRTRQRRAWVAREQATEGASAIDRAALASDSTCESTHHEMIVEQVTPRILHWLALGVCFALQNWRDKRLDRGLYSAVGETSGWNHFKKTKIKYIQRMSKLSPTKNERKKEKCDVCMSTILLLRGGYTQLLFFCLVSFCVWAHVMNQATESRLFQVDGVHSLFVNYFGGDGIHTIMMERKKGRKIVIIKFKINLCVRGLGVSSAFEFSGVMMQRWRA